jgi:hypothetical protein
MAAAVIAPSASLVSARNAVLARKSISGAAGVGLRGFRWHPRFVRD